MDTSLFHPRNINLPYGVDIAGNLAATQGNQAIAGLKGLGDIATGTGGIEARLSHAADLIDKYQADNEPELTPEGIEQLRSIAPGFMAAKNYLSHTPAGIAAHLIGKGYGKAFDIAGEAAGRVDPRLAGGVGVTREVLPWMIPGAGEAKEAEAVAEETGPMVKKAMQMSLSKATDPHIGHPEMGIIGFHPDATVIDAHDPETMEHVGRLIAEPSEDGTMMRGRSSEVFDEARRGKGIGTKLLSNGIDYAHDNGMDWGSDTNLSPTQYALYMKLREKGYPVEFHPQAEVNDQIATDPNGLPHMVAPNGEPVAIIRKPVPADDAVMGETPNPGAAAGGPSSYAEGGGVLTNFDQGAKVMNKADGGPARFAGGGGVIEDFVKLIAKNMKEPKPLNGAPTHIEGFGPVAPNSFIRALADQYKQDHGITTPSHPDFVRVDPAQAKRVADAYDAMQHNPSDPKVAAAYQAMIDETAKQYQYIKATGFKPEFIPEGAPDPYAANPRLAVKDINENNHMWVFPTSSGFGTLDPALADHPLLAHSGEYFGDQPATNNDLFRVVHDYFGHAKEGNGFRANGEENAWVQHAGMYSDLASPAMTAETRRQNSWVNSGPFADQNKGASGAKTVYANQKAGLLPDEFNVPPKVLDDQLGDNVVQAFMPKEKPPADIGEFPWNAANADTMKTPWSKRLKPIDMGGDPPTFAGGGGVLEEMAKLISRYGIKEAPQNVMHQGEYQRFMSPQPSPGDLAARYAVDLQGVDPKITAKAQQLGIDPTSQFLKPDEFARIAGRAPNVEGFNKIVSILPQAAEMASVAKAGEPKRGWYRASSQAILDVFGKEDAPRFAGLLAALSPQTSVESNLQNALRTWTNWEKAGRPTDPDQILAVLGSSVQGDKGMGSVLNAWVPNSVTALSHPEPTKMELSGFKVNSFMGNLLKDTQAVTNDAWMAHYGLPQPDELEKQGLLTPKQAAGAGAQTLWGQVPGYAAMTARTRQAADLAGVNPENVQESTWSVVKALSELGHGGVSRGNYLQQLALTHPDLAEKFAKPPGSSLQVLESGALTPNVVNSVPDFGSLMKDPQYGSLLADKYKDSIMDTPHPIWPDQVPLSTQDESHLQDVARRLDAANVTPSK